MPCLWLADKVEKLYPHVARQNLDVLPEGV
jgi:hypothetical protein